MGAAVASALATAHEAGVTHRDVKPANILLPRGGKPAAKLGDFGISRLAGAARLTSTGLLVGTPQFAAPEVAAGALAEPPADVYSFGLCLYLMLSGGRPPFVVEDENSPSHWLRAHTEEPARPITDFDAAVPAPLAALLERALAKDPGRRPTAAETATLLAALQSREVSAATTVPRPRKRRALMAGVTGGSLAAAAALALWTTGGGVASMRPQAPLDAAPVSAPRAPAPPPIVEATPVALAAPARIAAGPAPRPTAPAVAPVTSATAMPSAPPIAEPSPEPSPPASPLAVTTAAPPPAPSVASEAAATPPPAPPRAAERAAERPAEPSPAGMHLDGLLRAKSVNVGRHEGLPGQRPMVLVDALHGEEWIWFRFRLEGGASLRIARVSGERGEIASVVQEPSGGDLRVIVQVPRAAVTRSARLVLEVQDGPAYTFALGSRSLGRVLKDLFQ